MNKNKLLKPLLLIAVIILFCSVLARLFSESETLLEYAEKNPEVAYRKEEPDEAAGNKIENDTDHQTAMRTAILPIRSLWMTILLPLRYRQTKKI